MFDEASLRAEASRQLDALNFVMKAHLFQVDKGGLNYVSTHLLPVAQSVPPHLFIPALAHDVLEDTDTTLHDLRSSGIFLEKEVILIYALTKLDSEDYESYLKNLRNDEDARIIKLADIRNNTDPKRMARLDQDTRKRLKKKYTKALKILHFLEDDQ